MAEEFVCPPEESFSKGDKTVTEGAAALENHTNPLLELCAEQGLTLDGTTVTGCDKNAKTVTIPEGVKRIGEKAFEKCYSLKSIVIPRSVKAIEFGAFCQCKSLVSIALPEGLTTIGYGAFQWCEGITSVEIPKSVTEIGSWAFEFCLALKSVEISEGVTSIGSDAFSYCTSLTSINVDANNRKYKSIDGSLYTKDGGTLIRYAQGKKDKEFTVPESVTFIGESAFSGCTSLEGVVLTDGLKAIRMSAFRRCSSLKSIEIPKSVIYIDWCVFLGCKSLTSINIPEGVTTIGKGAFEQCDELSEIALPLSGMKNNHFSYIFGAKTDEETEKFIPNSLKKVIFTGGGVTSVGENALGSCKSIKSIVISEGIKSIDKKAFNGYKALESVEIPSSVTYIDENTFLGCSPELEIIVKGDKKRTKDWHKDWNVCEGEGLFAKRYKVKYEK